MLKWYFALFIMCLLTACKGKKKDLPTEESQFFPVLSYLKGQVALMDSSLNRIIKIETADGRADTTFLRREDFKTYAQDFTTIPDIGSAELKEDYTESKTYDEALKSILLTYTPKPSAKAEIVRQDVIAQPDATGTSEVKSIYIDRQVTQNDSVIEKKMLWQAGRRFSVATTASAKAGPAVTKKLELVWNDFSN
jgi:hypothetical protein